MAITGRLVTFVAGMALGLLGGGGSLLVIPALVYGFGRTPLEATTYSLLVVGSVSIVGAAVRHSMVRLPVRRIASFGVTSVLAAFLVRAAVVPRLSEAIAIGPVSLERDLVLMLVFAAFAGTAGVMMLRENCCVSGPSVSRCWVPLAGAATGALTGLLGIGGAFLILPALVLLVGLDMDEAVGASLTLVAAQSAAGVAGAIPTLGALNRSLVVTLVVTMLAGLAVGQAAGRRIAPDRLRRGFGMLTLGVALATAIQQIL